MNNTNLKQQSKSQYIDFDITLVDGDKVEKKNLDRQLFDKYDLSEYKTTSLSERYGDHYEIPCKVITQFVTNIEMLRNLFGDGDLWFGPKIERIPVLFAFVDNNKTRQLIHTFFESDDLETLIWIDAGIEGVMTSSNTTTDERTEQLEHSGFGGQIVCGFKYLGKTIMEPVTVVYPNILNDERTFFPGQSCGDAIVENPQRLITNQMAGQLATSILNNLIFNRSIFFHKINFNAQLSLSKPTYISKEVRLHYESIVEYNTKNLIE